MSRRATGRRASGVGAVLTAVAVVLLAASVPGRAAPPTPDGATATGSDSAAAAVYGSACAACHGRSGTGTARATEAFGGPLPDFTDCSFASREPDADWAGVVHEGGPTRAFSELMPAFGEALTEGEIQAALRHVRTFCTSDAWPRGELNLPRPLVTGKAYPEDEAVLTTTVPVEGTAAVGNQLVYERRFGPRAQLELIVPFGFRDRETADAGPDGWVGGLGDIGLAAKYVLFHSLPAGTVLSAGGEVFLPTGDEEDGFGTGTTVLEPYLALGQLLPAELFTHLQAGLAIPTGGDLTDRAFGRAALGRTWSSGRWGRAWTPMVELLANGELNSGGSVRWDLVPQLQVTLSRRQHVMANVGVRLPLDEADARQTVLYAYLLWDWFDGGLFDGW